MRLRSLLAPVLGVVTDAWAIGFGIFSLVFNGLLSLAIWRLTTNQKKSEGMEQRLHELTTKLVDERFRSFSHEVNGHVNSFVLTLQEMKGKLKEGEDVFGRLGDADHAAELKHLQRLEQIKDYIRDNTASKADVREHEKSVQSKFDRITEQLGELRTGVALLGQQLEARG